MPRANIIKKSVETKSGIVLGTVADIVIECDTQTVIQYVVSAGMLKKEKYIHHDQVIDITKEKIIVEDSLVDEQTQREKNAIAINTSAAAMREQT